MHRAVIFLGGATHRVKPLGLPVAKDTCGEVARRSRATSRSELTAAGPKKLVRKLAASWGRETQRIKLFPTLFENFGQAWPVNYVAN